MSTPFIEIPQRAPASPCTTTSPPRPVAPADWLALPSTITSPDMMFSASPVPALPRPRSVERRQARLERGLERVALAQPPGQVAGGDLGVVIGLEVDPLAAQLAAQPVVVGERPVVHEAEVVSGRERVRPFGRDAALGRHARVPEPVRAGEVAELERLSESARPADFFVDLDHAPGGHDAQIRVTRA